METKNRPNHSIGVRPDDYRQIKSLASEWGTTHTRLLGAMIRVWKSQTGETKLAAIKAAGSKRS